MPLPDKFIKLVNLFNESRKFKNALMVNSTITGQFFSGINNIENTTRITYLHGAPDNYETYVDTLKNIDTKFDLICVDPYHEYKESIETLNLILPLLAENGIIICHDCYPRIYKITSPIYIPNAWSGVTYAAFVEIANSNPEWYYAVIDRDYGLGIISKQPCKYVKQITDRTKQNIFLSIFKKNKYEEAYKYFKAHKKQIINMIT